VRDRGQNIAFEIKGAGSLATRQENAVIAEKLRPTSAIAVKNQMHTMVFVS
jgi:hypothetical protein